jgi:Tfp pilus assembly protein PilE
VVIAIIGILASVVLASLNSARSKGADAKVQGQLANARAAAEIYYASNNGYGITASSCTTANSIFVDAASGMKALATVANYPAGTTLVCNSTAAAWAMSANLSTTGKFWCVDSTGASKEEAAQLGSGITKCA